MRKLNLPCLAALFSTAFIAAASAEEALPGFEQPEPIVKQLPPEPDDEAANSGTFKVGDFDVRVSGSVTVDIGVGPVKPPRR
ncbi:hypothetical protein EET67_13645 [Pseudaminobacter arsenicus]|uniref:Porin n=1 Tax=Borborobacter arsenicus TaxID=1851146 RepID=A0A432V4N6_9HYPH|nr:hypothetical protein [Pseudaminobacter arsenicus]RUM97193.1 hypothetical protein EET67_13645 [Pseudaminobacter arsenicus]